MNKCDSIYINGLCIGCGLCAAICPINCIKMEVDNYDLKPHVDEKVCLNCGNCVKVCSSSDLKYINCFDIKNALGAEYGDILWAKSKDNKVLANSQSGGVVTTIVSKLLELGCYDDAFLVESDSMMLPRSTQKYDKKSNLSKTTGSCYLTILHENAARYILNNPQKKVIIVATGCVISSFRKLIELRKLCENNYFFIGLFCDKTMNYAVQKYFSMHKVNHDRKIKSIAYRCKQAGGWPGNLRLNYSNGEYEDLPISERGRIKEYFMPERCIYCLDKLNVNSDISVGDNYISHRADKDGISSVIVRTQIGKKIWSELSYLFEFGLDNENELIESQRLEDKRQNYINGVIKGVYIGGKNRALLRHKFYYCNIMRKIKIRDSKAENLYNIINKDIENCKIKLRIINFVLKPLRVIKRKIK